MTPKHSNLLTRHGSQCAVLIGALLLTGPFCTALAQTSLPIPQLSSDTEVATAGFYRLSWQTPEADDIQLQESDNPRFADAALRYQGPDDASVISGKPNGTWYYRARVIDDQQTGPWSEAVKVTVAHHPLSRALMFFTLGVVVFVATLLMVISGTKRGRSDGQ